MTELERVSVSRLYVTCSLQIRNIGQPGFAASDCCGLPAGGAVFDAVNEAYLYRCDGHYSVITLNPMRTGDFFREVPRKAQS